LKTRLPVRSALFKQRTGGSRLEGKSRFVLHFLGLLLEEAYLW
jgi:hypothetical protein